MLLLVTAIIYWPGLSGGFLLDDYPNIVNNRDIQISELNAESLLGAAKTYRSAVGRPLATISFAIDHAVHGKNPWGYKVTGLAVHLVNALLIFALALRLGALPAAGAKWGKGTALALALFWAVHPIQISSVLYIVQRMETMSLTFVLLALLAYIHGRTRQIAGLRAWPWLLAIPPLALLGLLCKESAVLFPVYALALEATVFRFRASSPAAARNWKVAYSLAVTCAGALFLFVVLPAHLDPALYAHRSFTLGERLLTQLRVLPMYLGQMLVPFPSSVHFYYDDFPLSRSLFNPITTLLGACIISALLAAAIALRRSNPLASLGLLWFFAAHLLTSTIVPLELVFEHRNYFALFGIGLTVAALLWRESSKREADLKHAVCCILIAFYLALGWIRSATWGDPLLLATDMVASNQQSPRASVDLASRYAGLADNDAHSPLYAFALAEFERGSRLPNSSPLAEQGLILMAAMAGESADRSWWLSLIKKLETRPIGAQERSAMTSLMARRFEGMAMDDQMLSGAYATYLRRSGYPTDLCVQYGEFALKYLQDDALAERMFVTAVEQGREHPAYVQALVAKLVSEGHIQVSIKAIDRAQALGLMDSTAAGAKSPAP
ncbi:MAG TPA: hypothetical protein VIT90_01585 [Lysobacter sp.]